MMKTLQGKVFCWGRFPVSWANFYPLTHIRISFWLCFAHKYAHTINFIGNRHHDPHLFHDRIWLCIEHSCATAKSPSTHQKRYTLLSIRCFFAFFLHVCFFLLYISSCHIRTQLRIQLIYKKNLDSSFKITSQLCWWVLPITSTMQISPIHHQ